MKVKVKPCRRRREPDVFDALADLCRACSRHSGEHQTFCVSAWPEDYNVYVYDSVTREGRYITDLCTALTRENLSESVEAVMAVSGWFRPEEAKS